MSHRRGSFVASLFASVATVAFGGMLPVAAQDAPIAERPVDVPAMVPFEAGVSRKLASAYDPDSPDGHGLHIAPGQVSTDVLPLFGGQLEFAGCATGDSGSLGRTVVLSRELDGTTYLAVHGHLSRIAPRLLEPDPERSPPVVGPRDVIGRHGPSERPDDPCPGVGSNADDLFVGLLRDATVGPSGGIVGGTPVSPEPLVGVQAYEGFGWWSGPVVGAKRVAATGDPRARWNETTPGSGSHLGFGEPVTLKARVRDTARIDQVRFRAWYPDWPRAAAGAGLPTFDPDASWREIAMCAAPGSPAVEYTSFCTWDGDTLDATVTYVWDPTIARRQPSAPWLPPARAAITRRTTDCVAVSLAVEVIDRAGHVHRELSDLPLPAACDDEIAEPVEGARVLYLDPLAPPRAPGSKDADERAWPADGDRLKGAITWRDRSDDEAGFHIYARGRWHTADCSVEEGAWQRVASVRHDKQRYLPRHEHVLRSLAGADVGDPPRSMTSWEYAVSAYNAAGETELVPVGGFRRGAGATCEPGVASPPEPED